MRRKDLIPTSFDCETFLIKQGVRTPKLVCASWKVKGELAQMATRAGALDAFEEIISNKRKLFVAANFGFDAGVCLAARPDLLPIFFEALADGRVSDIQIRQALIDIREGLYGLDRTQPSPHSERGYAPLKGRYRVEYLAKLYRQLDLSKDKNDPDSPRLRYCEMDGLPLEAYPENFKTYSLGDADHESDIWLDQEAYCEETGNHNLDREDDEVRAVWALNLMSIWGLRTDEEYVRKLAEQIEQEHEESRLKLLRAGLLKIQTCKRKKRDDGTGWDEEVADQIQQAHLDYVASLHGGTELPEWVGPFERAHAKGKKLRFATNTAELKRRVEVAYRGQPPLTDGGGVKTDRDTLFESSDEILELFGDSTNVEKLRGTYLPFLYQGAESQINSEFNGVVESLRTSAYDPNVQNLPSRGRYSIRPAFVAPPGWAYVSVDYSALEMVTLAECNYQLFGYSKMMDAINAGKDLHCMLGGGITGESYETFLAAVNAKDKKYKNVRQGAKAGNFGFGGFMGAPKFVLAKRKDWSPEFPDGLRFCELLGRLPKCGQAGVVMEHQGRPCPPVCPVCLEIASNIRKVYFETWEEMNDFQRYVQRATRAEGHATLIIPGTTVERGKCAYSAFANGHFQGLAAVGAKRALWDVAQECYVDRKSPLFGCRPVVFVHDEIIIEAPLDRLHESAYRLRDVMVNAMQQVTPHVKVSAEPAAAVRWYKEMDKRFDAAGRLIPWEPK